MTPCPTAQELTQLLDEELSDAQHKVLAAHVGSCASCQTVLERLTELNGELSRVSCSSASKSGPNGEKNPDAQAGFLTHLKECPPPSFSRSAPSGSPPEQPTLHEPPVVAGYEILGELGRGGMGVVYKARHVALDRVVALKMILAGSHAGPKDRERFRQEAAAIARLHHPHIVQVFDSGDAGGRPYFALEYVEQGSLAQHLHGEPQPLQTILPLLEMLARAMAYAHQCGIIHRDLKPANILLGTRSEAAEETENPLSFVLDRAYSPKITDFGLAKRLGEEGARSLSHEVLGTPSYMAPEQADVKAREIGPATDVYALGAILYEMLTGRPPFKGVTSLDTLLQVLHEEPVRPSRLRPKLPRDIETICLKCLEKEPARRYASASALADDLRRFRRGAPIEARPVGVVERGWKWARRRPASAALVAGIVLVALLGFTGVTWQWRVAVKERNEQEYQRQQARTSLYHSRIAQSQLQWRVNDLPGALRSLEDCHRPGDQHDRRGWEWYYLWKLYRPELFAFSHTRPGPEGNVTFDPKGATIASVINYPPDNESKRGELCLWDAFSGKAILTKTLASPFHRLAFRSDGKRLVLGSTDGTVVVWDTTNDQETWHASLPTYRITGVAFSADGKSVAATAISSLDPERRGEIKLWDAERGTEQQILNTKQIEGGFYCLAFHPKLPLLVTGGEDRMVRIWNITTGQEERPRLEGHKSAVYGVAFSPDGKLLVSAGNNGNMKIWNLEQKKAKPQSPEARDGISKQPIVPQSLTGRTGAILSLAFSPDSRYFAYCGTDKTVRVWDLDSGTGSVTFRGHRAIVESVQFSPDGQRLVSCSPSEGEVKVWDLTTHPEFCTLVRTTGDKDHPARDVESLAFHENGRELVSVTVVGELQVWDANSGLLHAQHSLPISAEPLDLGGMLAAFAPGGRRLAARCREDRRWVGIWDVDRGEQLLSCRGHRLPVCCLRFSADGRYLATSASELEPGGKPFEIKIWNATTGEQVGELGGAGRVLSLAFSPDGRWLIAGNDEQLHVFDWAAGREAFAPLGAHQGKITALAFRSDGGRIASGGLHGKTIHVWDSHGWDSSQENRQPLLRLAAPPLLCDLAFSPDGKRLVGASRDLIKMWDAETGEEVLTLRGAPQRYRDPPFNARVAFHPDGTRLAGSNWNESISIWDAPQAVDEENRVQQQLARRRAATERADFWHLQEAEYCVEHKMESGAQFHLQRLRNALLPPLLQARKERILAKIGREPK